MITWRDEGGGLHQGSLFGAFAALARGEAWSFPALRPHQREPWHAFTVQVAALALIRTGTDTLPLDEAGWRDLLLGLTPGQPEAWELVVDDWSKPALLQPPVAEKNRAEYRVKSDEIFRTPDALDVLITAKNHDLKSARVAQASEEDWLFTLVALQTSAAYGGNRTYGASRMNSKTGSRFIVRARPGKGFAAAFRRDVPLLAASARGESGKALLWIEANDRRVSLAFPTLAPSLYVDCARRVRLRRKGVLIEALTATDDRALIAAEALAGKTGDPYAPVSPDGDASITPKRDTFGYKRLSKLLAAPLPLLAQVHDSDATCDLSISFSALVRRGGTDFTTEGLFERVIRTSRVDELYQHGPQIVHDRMGNAAIRRAHEAGAAGGKLKYALLILLQGAPSEPGMQKRLAVRMNDKSSNDRAKTWVELLDRRVDQIFFDAPFWAEVLDDEGDHRQTWRERLRDEAVAVFDEAVKAAPRSAMRRIRATARAKSYLEGSMKDWIEEVA